MPRPKREQICHPDRAYYAKGRCQACYSKLQRELKPVLHKDAIRTWAKEHPENILTYAAKRRAKASGLPFSIKPSDIRIPSYCPVLGIPLIYRNGRFSANSPSLDRIDNMKGYTKENVIVVSFRANSLKKDATPVELRKVADFYTTLQSSLTDGTAR